MHVPTPILCAALFLGLLATAPVLTAADQPVREPEYELTSQAPNPALLPPAEVAKFKELVIKPAMAPAETAAKRVELRDIAPPPIVGIAAFVEDRVEAELRAWATDAVVRSLCTRTSSSKYFVNTCGLTGPNGTYRDIYSVPGANHLLVSALRADGTALPMKILQENPAVKSDLQQLELARVLIAVVDQLRRGRPPLSVLAGLQNQPTLVTHCAAKPDDGNPICRLLLVSLVAHAYQSAGADQELFASALKQAAAEAAKQHADKAFEQATKLLTSWADEIIGSTSSNTKTKLRGLKQGLFADLQQSAVAIRDAVDRVSEARRARDRTTEVNEIVGLVLEVRTFIARASAYESGDAPPTFKPLQEEWISVVTHLALGNFHDAMFGIAKTADCGDVKNHPVCSVLPVALTIASARDQQEIHAVLEAYSSPLGAWRGRQDQPMTSIAAWPGVGYEKATWDPDGAATQYTVFMPVGFARSWPIARNSTQLGKLSDWFGSCGVLLSVVDIGYLLRAEEAQATGVGQLEPEDYDSFSDYLSLGLYARATFRNSPISIGLGASYSPNQRVELVAGAPRDVNTIRLMAFIGMEITLFPL